MSVVIEIKGVSKKYVLGHQRQDRYIALRDVLMHKTRSFGQRLRHPLSPNAEVIESEDFWALSDINLAISEGEKIGIIGRNGAGKSTLLKILCRITAPTTGSFTIAGRVSSLLEVGTGFHPELTGRENIFLNGAILGMTRAEIKTRFDQIVSFSEIEKFLDTPVKRYSSGMYVRLAFSVAAHLEPEILIIDEVLAVGDASFQKKCLGSMENSAKSGKTILFVSHNMTAIQRLCERAVWLEDGRIRQSGPAREVVAAYLAAQSGSLAEKIWPDSVAAPGNPAASLKAIRLTNSNGVTVSQLDISDSFFIEIDYRVESPGVILNTSISLFNDEDVYVLASPSSSDPNWFLKPHPVGEYQSKCKIPATFLNQGRFSVTVILVQNGSEIIAQVEKEISIELLDSGKSRGSFFGFWGGVVRPNLEWTTTMLQK